MGNNIRSLQIEFFSFLDRLLQIFIDLLWQTFLHHRIIKYVFSKDLGYIDQFCTHMQSLPSSFPTKKGHSKLCWNALVLLYV